MAVGNVGLAAQSEARTTTGFKMFLSRYFYFARLWCLPGWSCGVSATRSMPTSSTLSHQGLCCCGCMARCSPPGWFSSLHSRGWSGWHKVSVHRTLGWFGAGLATVMVALGFTIAVVMARFDTVVLHQKDADAFLAIPFWDMIFFGTCIALAILWKKKPDFHRRLIFLATCELMDAAIGRFDFWFNHSIFYVGLDLLIVLGMTRDLIVDRRIHRVYLYALPVLIVGQILSVYIWKVNPGWWSAIAHPILGW